MPSSLVLFSVGDVAIAAVAMTLFVYEAWLGWIGRRVGQRHVEHQALAVCCLGAAVFAGGMAVQYNASREVALWATRAEALALCAIVYGMAVFAVQVTGRVPPGGRRGLLVLAVVSVVINVSPFLVAEIELREVVGLARPFPRRVDSPLGTVGVLAALALAGWASWVLVRARARRGDAAWFGLAVAGWTLAGAHDVAQGLLAGPMRAPLTEYGFFLFALTLVARDVVAHHAMLVRSQSDFRSLVEQTPDAVWVLRHGRVMWANAAAARLLGATPEQLRGKAIGTIVVDPATSARLARTLTGQEAVGPLEVAVRGDAGTAQVELVGVGVDFEGASATVVVARDLTDRQQLMARMVELDRMITAGTLAAGVGHEINNPLAYALLNLREARGIAPPAVDVHLAESEEGMRRIEGIVAALRSFARSDDGNDAVALESVVRASVAVAGNEVRLRAQLDVDVAPNLVVWGGQTRLSQVLTNLIINAAQAIPPGAPRDHRVSVRGWDEEGDVVIEVRDTGEGIPSQRLARIFDPFFTTKRASEGTGLGLTICRQKVEELGGSIRVESVEGQGTAFFVRLPRASATALRCEPAMPDSAPEGPVDLIVLIVDDERPLVRALRRTLQRHVRVEVDYDGADALARLERGERFDLILSDLMMPRCSGEELYAEVLRRWPEQAERMCFMSGGAFTEEARAFCNAMPGRMWSKPLDVDALVALLQRRAGKAQEARCPRAHSAEPQDPTPCGARPALPPSDGHDADARGPCQDAEAGDVVSATMPERQPSRRDDPFTRATHPAAARASPPPADGIA